MPMSEARHRGYHVSACYTLHTHQKWGDYLSTQDFFGMFALAGLLEVKDDTGMRIALPTPLIPAECPDIARFSFAITRQ